MNRGFTMIELLVAVAAIAILSAVLSAVLVRAQQSAAIDKTRADLVAQGRLLADETTRNLKMAVGVVPSATVSGTDYVTDNNTVIMEISAIDSNQNIVSGAFDRLVYNLSGGTYELVQEGHSNSIRPTRRDTLTTNVSSLTFSYFDENGTALVGSYENTASVQINITLENTVRGRLVSVNFSERVTLRNK